MSATLSITSVVVASSLSAVASSSLSAVVASYLFLVVASVATRSPGRAEIASSPTAPRNDKGVWAPRYDEGVRAPRNDEWVWASPWHEILHEPHHKFSIS